VTLGRRIFAPSMRLALAPPNGEAKIGRIRSRLRLAGDAVGPRFI
jgi:hypothetical protein